MVQILYPCSRISDPAWRMGTGFLISRPPDRDRDYKIIDNLDIDNFYFAPGSRIYKLLMSCYYSFLLCIFLLCFFLVPLHAFSVMSFPFFFSFVMALFSLPLTSQRVYDDKYHHQDFFLKWQHLKLPKALISIPVIRAHRLTWMCEIHSMIDVADDLYKLEHREQCLLPCCLS